MEAPRPAGAAQPHPIVLSLPLICDKAHDAETDDAGEEPDRYADPAPRRLLLARGRDGLTGLVRERADRAQNQNAPHDVARADLARARHRHRSRDDAAVVAETAHCSD